MAYGMDPTLQTSALGGGIDPSTGTTFGETMAKNSSAQALQEQLVAQAIEHTKQAQIGTQVEQAQFDAHTYLSEKGLLPKEQAIAQLEIVLIKEHAPEAEMSRIMKIAQERLPAVMQGEHLYWWYQALKNPPPIHTKEVIATAEDALTKKDPSGDPVIAGRGYIVDDQDVWRLSGKSQAEMDAAAKLAHPAKSPAAGSNSVSFVGNTPDGKPVLMDKQGNFKVGDTSAFGGGPVVPKTSTLPTSATRGSSEFAESILPHIQEMRDLIQKADAKGYIGPVAGRVYGQFLTGEVGSTGDVEADTILGELRATDSLMKSATMRVHFGSRGGQQMYDHFSEILNTGKQSAAVLNAALNGIEKYMRKYVQAGHPYSTANPTTPATTPATAPADANDPLGIRKFVKPK